jgi:hypothetical protein
MPPSLILMKTGIKAMFEYTLGGKVKQVAEGELVWVR